MLDRVMRAVRIAFIIVRNLVLLALFLEAVWGAHYVGWLILRRSLPANPTVSNVPVPSAYICPANNQTGEPEATQVATCKDCTYYPVDKVHGLPPTYTPAVVPTGLPGGGMLLPIARDALTLLFDDAHHHGIYPVVTSAYRSYAEQVITFNAWAAQEFLQHPNLEQAIANAERYSAAPGHSEHQLGTAVDLNCSTCAAFDRGNPKNQALWDYLDQNAYRFGFVISYPYDDEARTGYLYEPWHLRYIGLSNAADLYDHAYLSGNGVCSLGLLHDKRLYDGE